MSISLLDPPIFQPNGAYTRDEAEIVAEGFALWASGHISLQLPPRELVETIRMPRMFLVVAVQDGVLRLCGIKPDREEYCSCSVESRDPRRCAHLWALTYILGAQRPRTIKHRLGLEPDTSGASSRSGSRPTSPDLGRMFRPQSPQQVEPLLRTVQRRSSHHPSLDHIGVGIVDMLARSPSFVRTFRRAFKNADIESLTVSYLAQLFRNVEHGLAGDHVNVLTALKIDRILSDKPPPEPAELLQRIVRHCDAESGGSALHALLQWKAEASLRCMNCDLLSFGRDVYTHWRQSVYPWLSGSHAPSLDRLLQCALFDAAHTKCRRCKALTLHRVAHTPVMYGNLLLVRVVTPSDRESTGSFIIPPRFRDKGLGHEWRLVGLLCFHSDGREGGDYTMIVMQDGRLVELDEGMPMPHKVCGLSAPPVLILYEREDE